VSVEQTFQPDIQQALPFGSEVSHSVDAVVNERPNSENQELAICETEVIVIEFGKELLAELRRNPAELLKLTPEQFELFLCDRLVVMGMEVKRVGSIHQPDGGIDILAWPRRPTAFPFLLGVQAKHHNSWSKKVGVRHVREFDSAIRHRPLQAGLLVTNTSFTANATWEVENHKQIIRLRHFEDLRRWIADNFVDEAEWREIPEQIEYLPGRFVRLRPG
jgi:hypothetical protein